MWSRLKGLKKKYKNKCKTKSLKYGNDYNVIFISSGTPVNYRRRKRQEQKEGAFPGADSWPKYLQERSFRQTSKELQASMGELRDTNHCWPERNQRLTSHLPINVLMTSMTFDESKFELFGRHGSGGKLTQHSIQTAKHGVWRSGAALLFQELKD